MAIDNKIEQAMVSTLGPWVASNNCSNPLSLSLSLSLYLSLSLSPQSHSLTELLLLLLSPQDLVKSHLMFAVREEVEVLKDKIAELMDRINQLELENSILKANATQETLEQLVATPKPGAAPGSPQQQQQQQQSQPQPQPGGQAVHNGSP